MTESEEITGLISKKFFLNQYIYNDIYVKIGKQECEFCDCLMEFGGVYICIQIKERNPNAEGSSKRWFDDKVRGLAKSQQKKTIKYFKDTSNTIFSKSSELSLDRSKTIIPVIVFVNADIIAYDRIVYAKSLQTIINIFSYEDFKTMLETIVIPFDIITYLQYRVAFKKSDEGKMIFDEADENATLLFRPECEKDYAQMFLMRTYHKSIIKQGVKEEYVDFYNSILLQMNEKTGCIRSDFIEGFLQVDYERADIIARNWIKCVDSAKSEKYIAPFVFSLKNRVYMFFSHPQSMTREVFQYKLNLCLVYYKYKHVSIDKAHILEFSNEKGNDYSVNLYDIDMNIGIPYEKLIADAKTFFESK